mgnify:CR=1 FL=1
MTQTELAALRSLGVAIEEPDPHTYVVTGAGGPFPATEADLFIGNAGTGTMNVTDGAMARVTNNIGGVANIELGVVETGDGTLSISGASSISRT